MWKKLAAYIAKNDSGSFGCVVVRATNSKLLGTKILEVSKKFRVELENT